MKWDQIEGWFSVHDADFVRKICEGIHNGIVVELGCYAGRSTAVMAPVCKTNNNSYHAIDNFEGSDPKDPATRNQKSRDMQQVLRANMDKLQLLDYIDIHKMDSSKAACMFQDEKVDFCFIDASHVAEDVKRDIEAWWPKIKRGCFPNSKCCGVLGGHDYKWPGVKQVVDAFVDVNKLKLVLGKDGQCWKVTKSKE